MSGEGRRWLDGSLTVEQRVAAALDAGLALGERLATVGPGTPEQAAYADGWFDGWAACEHEQAQAWRVLAAKVGRLARRPVSDGRSVEDTGGVTVNSSRVPERVRVAGDLFHGRVPAGAVYVGRGAPGLPASHYANQHRIGRPCSWCDGAVHDRPGAVAAYEQQVLADPGQVEAIRRDLAGRDLACWCPLEDKQGGRTPCHADVLLRVANSPDPEVR